MTEENQPTLPLYEGINPKNGYNSNEFNEEFQKLAKIQGGLETLSKDSGDSGAIRGLGRILYGDERYPYTRFQGAPSEHVRNSGNNALGIGQAKMSEYIKNNSEEIYNELNAESKEAFVQNADFLKDSGNKKYESYLNTIGTRKLLEEIYKENDTESMKEYLGAKLKDIPEWLTEEFFTYSGNENWVKPLFDFFADFDLNKIKSTLENTSKEDINKFGKLVIKNAKEKNNAKTYAILGQVLYRQMNPPKGQ